MKFSTFINESHNIDTCWVILRAYQERFGYKLEGEDMTDGDILELNTLIKKVKSLITKDTNIVYVGADTTLYTPNKKDKGVDLGDYLEGEWCITDCGMGDEVLFVGPKAKELSKMFGNISYKKLPKKLELY